MGLKEAFRKVGQAIEETKMKIGMKKYKKGGIQVEEKDQKPEMVIPVMAFAEMMENIRQVADKISEIFRRIHENNTMTETQIRKRELWRRYYEEKSRMSNNERRRRGIPMVKRPKRQQYRPPKKKTTKG